MRARSSVCKTVQWQYNQAVQSRRLVVLLEAVSDGVQTPRDAAEQAVHARQVISLQGGTIAGKAVQSKHAVSTILLVLGQQLNFHIHANTTHTTACNQQQQCDQCASIQSCISKHMCAQKEDQNYQE
jgi:hypothetical protein